MLENDEYKMQPLMLPTPLVARVVDDVTNRLDGFDEKLLEQRRLFMEQDIRNFTAQSVLSFGEGQFGGGKRVLLMRDLLSHTETRFLKDRRPPIYLEEIEKAFMDIRLALGANLLMHGADPLVETGILTEDDFDGDIARKIKESSRWARLKSGKDASKINYIRNVSMATGPRLTHPFLQPEVVYSLADPKLQLHQRYRLGTFKSQCFYATTAEYVGGHRGMREALLANPGPDGLNKYMLDLLNSMEAINSLHEKQIVHRDIKPENIWEGGKVFDNATAIPVAEIDHRDISIIGTPFFMPEGYDVGWDQSIFTPYFRDIFAFAISISDAVAVSRGDMDAHMIFYPANERGRNNFISPEAFMDRLRDSFFGGYPDEKTLKTYQVVEKMISEMGKFTLAEAQRELAEIFGVNE